MKYQCPNNDGEQQRRREPPWSPTERKCLSLLNHRNNQTRSSILQIHSFMLRHALETNVNLLTKFITTCSAIATTTLIASSSNAFIGIYHARQVFDQRPQRGDAFLCNSMMKSHVVVGQFAEAVTLYRNLMRDTDFSPDNYTFLSLAKSCCSRSPSLGNWVGKEVHNHVVKHGFGSDLFVSTALVDMYAKIGDIGCARKMLDEMPERSLVSWTALVGGYARCVDVGCARELFDEMPVRDVAAFNVMVDGYIKMGDMGSARQLFDGMGEKNVLSWTSMVDGYCKNGNVSEARLLFDAMPEKNLVSWNAMIGGYCKNRQPHEALKLFHELQSQTSLEPNSITIVSILPAIADLGALDLGGWIHQLVKRMMLDKAINVCTALVDMYAKCGDIRKARIVFDGMPKREAVTWNALIYGLAINGCAKEALEAFSEMKKKGFKPNEITMIGVLSACNHGGLVEEGKHLFKAMEDFRLVPKIEHYGCMVDLLGRAGCFNEAENVIKSMPYEVNGIILSSFLFACWNAKDLTRVERLIKKSAEVDPMNDGIYIILRKLYATGRRWVDVEEIKGLMRRKGTKKEVGCSVIEVNSKVLEFVAGDQMHLQWTVIHPVLGQLWMHMRGQDT